MATHPDSNALQTQPSFRLEDQELAENQTAASIIGPPSYASPDPATNAARLVPIDEHPLHLTGRLSEDYGEAYQDDHDAPLSTLMPQGEILPDRDVDGKVVLTELPDNRDEWSRSQWQVFAANMGVGSSGSTKVIRERVERREAEDAEKSDRAKELKDMTRDELNAAARESDIDPEQYSTMDELLPVVTAAELGDDYEA